MSTITAQRTTRHQVGSNPDRSAASRTRGGMLLGESTDRVMLIDRIQQLRLLLPAMAHETAVARRDNARLRAEAKMLAKRVAELEAQASQLTR